MTLHIFNPDHDLALAANKDNYTAPHAARQLRSELSFLPALWAQDGDVVLVDDVAAAHNAYRKLKLEKRAEVQFATLHEVKALFGDRRMVTVHPWGWDKPLCAALLAAGIPAEAVPSRVTLDIIRDLSNRTLAVKLLDHLKDNEGVTGFSRTCNTYEEVIMFLEWNRDIVVKAPWSCSGRGVRYLNADKVSENTLLWVNNTICAQHTVVAEVKCPKVIDFAVEFMAGKDGAIKACGLSLFSTVNGAYTGNQLATEDEKRKRLAEYIPLALLDMVTEEIERFLAGHIRGAYVGPLGVDMMVVAGDDRFLLNPCVEINLRRTMGHVALALSQRGHRGTMDIAFENKSYKVKLK